MLVAFCLYFLFITESPSHALTSCFSVRDERTAALIPAPSVPDCNHIIAYLPQPLDAAIDFLNPNLSGVSAHASSRVSPVHPFFPFNEVGHGACVLIIRYYEGVTPSNLYDAALSKNHKTPRIPLTEQSVFRVWSTQREAAQRLVTHCAENGLAGLEWDALDLPEMPIAWYAASLMRSRPSSSTAGKLRVAQQKALRGKRRQWHKLWFRVNFFDV